MYGVAKHSLLIQYQIQLFLCDFHSGFSGRSAASIAARRGQLHNYWSPWNRLEPAERTAVNLCGTMGTNEFVGGVFSTAVGEKRTSLHFIRLPSISRGITQEEWTLNNLSMPIDGYSTDPTSDLLIVYEDQRFAYSRSVISLQLGNYRGRFEPRPSESACVFSRLLMEGNIQEPLFRLSHVRWKTATSFLTYPSVGHRCACVSVDHIPTIPLFGSGQLTN